MKILTKNNLIYAALLIAMILIIAAIFIPLKSSAIPTISAFNFGGKIIASVPCPCNGGQLITVGPPVPGIFFFQFLASTLFPNGQIFRPGAWALGSYEPKAAQPCLSGALCLPIGQSQGTIITVGTSF